MFNNVGGKIKGLAQVLTWIGIAASIIGALIQTKTSIILAVLTLGLGILFSWLSNLVLYGFGELVENSSIIAKESQYHKDYQQNN